MSLLIRERVQEVFDRTYLMTLATYDTDGVWAADVIFVADDHFRIYWMSKPGRRHSQAIARTPNVAATITVTSQPSDPELAIQVSGHAEMVDEIDFELIKKYFRKREKPEPQREDDVLGEHVWYRVVPDRIELIDAENFGRERQSVDLNPSL